MAQLNAEKINKLKRGELVGILATAFCGAVLIYFAACFSMAYYNNNQTLFTIVWATAPALMVLGVAIAAFCNLKYGRAIENIIKQYVTAVFVENAAAMHPERNSLSFFIGLENNSIVITVNGYKDRIIFDFTAFGKLSASRKAGILKIITEKLSSTFCKLYERGGNYSSVDYREKDGTRRKSGKTVPVITAGVPDKRAMKNYLKNR